MAPSQIATVVPYTQTEPFVYVYDRMFRTAILVKSPATGTFQKS